MTYRARLLNEFIFTAMFSVIHIYTPFFYSRAPLRMLADISSSVGILLRAARHPAQSGDTFDDYSLPDFLLLHFCGVALLLR